MIKKIITIIIIIFAFFGLYKITSKKPDSITLINPDSELFLFYGDTCPDCKDVEEFIAKNQIDQKLKINNLEVYSNKPNSSLFFEMVNETCPNNSSPEGIPVPFLINKKDKQCFLGTPAITEYLSEKSK
jgi:glutaredoxin-related protein